MAYSEGPILRCPQCGYELETGARQCRMCYLPVPRAVRARMKRGARATVPPGAGPEAHPIAAPEPPPPPAPAPAPLPTPAPAPAPPPASAPAPAPEPAAPATALPVYQPAPTPVLGGVPWVDPPVPDPPAPHSHADRRRLVRRLVVGGVALIVLLVAAVVVVPRFTGPSYPSEWDARVAPIVDQVEEIRGLEFEHPVEVRFLDEDEFVAEIGRNDGEITEAASEQIDQAAALFRSLGLMQGTGDDLLAATGATAESQVTGFYDSDDEVMVIRGAELTPATKVVVAHELTHALQDQHFDLEQLRQATASDAEAEALLALVEGDATRVEALYTRELPAGEQAELAASRPNDASATAPELDAVPEILGAMFSAPYQVGPLFVEALASSGDEVVDEAFRLPPLSTEQVLSPASYLDGDEPNPVEGGPLPDGDTRVGSLDHLGALGWYYVLASRVPADTALEAALGWGGDEMVQFERAGTACTRLTYLGDTPEDSERMGAAVDEWVGQMPAGTADAAMTDRGVTLTSCDPGTAFSPPPRSVRAAADALEVRAALAFLLVEDGAPLAPAESAATELAFDPAVAEFLADPEPSPEQIDEFRGRVEDAYTAAL